MPDMCIFIRAKYFCIVCKFLVYLESGKVEKFHFVTFSMTMINFSRMSLELCPRNQL